MFLWKNIVNGIFSKYRYVWLLMFSCAVIVIIMTFINDWGILYGDRLRPPKRSPYMFYFRLVLIPLIIGLFSDKFFRGKRWRPAILLHLSMLLLLLLFWFIPINVLKSCYDHLLFLSVFFYYGLVVLIMTTAFELSFKENRCTVISLIFSWIAALSSLSHFLMSFVIKHIGEESFSNLIWPSLCGLVLLSALGVWKGIGQK